MSMSSMWSVIDGASGSAGSDMLLNSQLANALSATGDAQFWEESISPASIRDDLSKADPSNPSHTHTLLKGMKWLLASISKGRDVSDFYALVVKLVGAANLEVRKMVYMYLVQYANHDPTTRELSLLSINSFQRGLADASQLIRALALRVLTSIHIPDILQIQILAVQKMAKDHSAYVRKCAANALAKLHSRCDRQQHQLLIDAMQELLTQDTATMVLTSALVAMVEICPDRLELLHTPFRKICHLLTDMDEWGQVVVIELLARYCRRYFREPYGWRQGTAEQIDQERRVRRTLQGTTATTKSSNKNTKLNITPTLADQAAQAGVVLPPRNEIKKQTVKRRVVRKGFYSDEEDESTEEEVEIGTTQRDEKGESRTPHHLESINEDAELADDHRLLLNSATPLLRSRNAGVVLAVCSLLYYCGVASVKVRAAMGKALVRIHRDRKREIQYVVLSSIRTLVTECPSAFSPFLHDFFIVSIDPPFTRLIKLDILTSLALDPHAIETVLKELRTYIRLGDTEFSKASIRAVGKIAELARILHDRHGRKKGNFEQERGQANLIALNCLYGLLTLTQTSEKEAIVGESVLVMQQIFQMLLSDNDVVVEDPNGVRDRSLRRICMLLFNALNLRVPKKEHDEDGNDDDEEQSQLESMSVNLPPAAAAAALWLIGEYLAPLTPSSAMQLGKLDDATRAKLRCELCRLLARSFPELDVLEKEQAFHLACKLLISKASENVQVEPHESPLCEHILAMGRLDTNVDVRDRARFESNLINLSIGLQTDRDNMDDVALPNQKLSIEDLQKMLLQRKPAPSCLPLEQTFSTAAGEAGGFRFGTLSSLVGHRARSAYMPLPPWAETDSPSSLREPVVEKSADGERTPSRPSGFYVSSSSSSGSESSSAASSKSGESSSSNETSSEDESSPSSASSYSAKDPQPTSSSRRTILPNVSPGNGHKKGPPAIATSSSSSDESSNASSESEESSTEDEATPVEETGNLLGEEPLLPNNRRASAPKFKAGQLAYYKSSSMAGQAEVINVHHDDKMVPYYTIRIDGKEKQTDESYLSPLTSSTSSLPKSNVLDDFRGMTLAPVPSSTTNESTSKDLDAGAWVNLVRPDMSNGLLVEYRVLRGARKVKEANLLGLVGDAPNVSVMELRMENKRKDGGVFRRLKCLQRSASSSSSTSIGPRRVVLPPDVEQLRVSQSVECCMGVEFLKASDRDGTLCCKLEIKHSTSSHAVEIRLSLGDVLLPCRKSVKEFGDETSRMVGFNRVETSIPKIDDDSVVEDRLLDVAALTVVDKNRWVGCLPASNDPIFVQCDGSKLVVCSDNALAVTSLLNLLKKALMV